MHTLSSKDILENYAEWWRAHSRQADQVHGRFLEMRQAGLRRLAGGLERQVETLRLQAPAAPGVLMTLDDLNEFATGSIVKCLGPEYSVYAGRRGLRIPNRDLLLMSRVLTIRGQKGNFNDPSSIIAEYDVPTEAWFFAGEAGGRLPYSICIELALQPCGVLSAYLGTALRHPGIDYFFRNLDGATTFSRLVDARGRTVRARAELHKTIFYGSTIIQHFSFDLSCDGETFFEGKSSFGYFSPEAMASQNGLDGGKTVLPWGKQAGHENSVFPVEATWLEEHLPQGKLRLLDTVEINEGGGTDQGGYVVASRRNDPGDWFYSCHFYGDPVMPGSLGIEAIAQAMKIFIARRSDRRPDADFVVGQKMTWSYRGQVLQHHRRMQVEVHIRKTEPGRVGDIFTGDASLWADDSRIYELRNMSLGIDQVQD